MNLYITVYISVYENMKYLLICYAKVTIVSRYWTIQRDNETNQSLLLIYWMHCNWVDWIRATFKCHYFDGFKWKIENQLLNPWLKSWNSTPSFIDYWVCCSLMKMMTAMMMCLFVSGFDAYAFISVDLIGFFFLLLCPFQRY